MKKLILFDFDGTITYKDSMLEIFRSKSGTLKYYAGFIRYLPALMSMKLGITSAQKVKEKLIAFHFSGMSIDQFNEFCRSFATRNIPKLLRPKAYDQLKQYISAGDRVIIISASLENWLMPWTRDLGIELLATRLDAENGVVTGKILGRNCKGVEKVNRLQQHLNLADYEKIIAFGDSKGDKEMLELADEKFYKYF